MTRWHSAILDIKTNHTTECDVLSPGLNPVGSFYGRRCARETDTEAAQFKMSWGYNKLSDSAVVTVCLYVLSNERGTGTIYANRSRP
jgi:hypothetical protein